LRERKIQVSTNHIYYDDYLIFMAKGIESDLKVNKQKQPYEHLREVFNLSVAFIV